MDQDHSPGTARAGAAKAWLVAIGLVLAALAGTVTAADIVVPSTLKPVMICAWSSGCTGTS
jgi:hypothetical protein